MSSVNRAVGRAGPHHHRPRWAGWTALALGALMAAGGGWLIYKSSVDTESTLQGTAGQGAGIASDFWQRPGASSAGSENMQNRGAAAANGAGPVAAVEVALQALARPQELALDAVGHLRLTRALRNRLDDSLGWFDGPVNPEALERARQKLRQELSGIAQVDALRVLDSYAAYRNAAAEQQAKPSVTSALPANLGVMGEAMQLQRRSALRNQMLDADMREAFFADEEALDQYRLAILQVQSMPSFTEAERAEQLRPLWQQLPAHVRTQIPTPGSTSAAKSE
jgi:hypothetical protein